MKESRENNSKCNVFLFLQVLHTSAGVLGQKEVHAGDQNTLYEKKKKR
jgi:hypothetical protein